jgi:hypothetical protein
MMPAEYHPNNIPEKRVGLHYPLLTAFPHPPSLENTRLLTNLYFQ